MKELKKGICPNCIPCSLFISITKVAGNGTVKSNRKPRCFLFKSHLNLYATQHYRQLRGNENTFCCFTVGNHPTAYSKLSF